MDAVKKYSSKISVYWNRANQRGSFTQNILLVLSGNVLATVIGFLFTPVMTRIYTPEAYGTFSFFLALVQTISSVATLQLTRAFVLPKDEADFRGLLWLSMICGIFFTVAGCFVFIIWGVDILLAFKAQSLKDYLYLIPVCVLLTWTSDVFRSWGIRLKQFKQGGYAQVAAAMSSRAAGISVGLGYGGVTSFGLIIGEMIYKVTESITLVLKSGRELFKIQVIDRAKLVETLNKYRSYPMYVLPSTWIASLNNQLPIYFLMSGFSSSVVGHFSLANRLLGIPAIILINSLAPVFLQQAAASYHISKSNVTALIDKLYIKLLLFCVFPFFGLMVFGEPVFAFFLGEAWRVAGHMAFFLGVYFPFYITASSLSSVFRIFGKERLNMIFSFAVTFVNGIVLFLGTTYFDIFSTFMMYGFANMLLYLMQLLIILKLAEVTRYFKLMMVTGIFVAISLAVGWYRFS